MEQKSEEKHKNEEMMHQTEHQTEHQNQQSDHKHQRTLPQKILYIFLIALLVLMVVFSIRAMKDKGLEGYNTCVQKKCDEKGTDFCEKTREKNNCCLGAGGQLGQNQQGLTCVFE